MFMFIQLDWAVFVRHPKSGPTGLTELHNCGPPKLKLQTRIASRLGSDTMCAAMRLALADVQTGGRHFPRVAVAALVVVLVLVVSVVVRPSLHLAAAQISSGKYCCPVPADLKPSANPSPDKVCVRLHDTSGASQPPL